MRDEANRDEALEALWELREAEMAEEEAFERRMALLRAYIEWIEGLPDEAVFSYVCEDGGDAMRVEEAGEGCLGKQVGGGAGNL